MSNKRLLAALLLCALLLPGFASCSEQTVEETPPVTAVPSDSATDPGEAAEPEEEVRNPLLDDITDTFDFEGDTFTISLPQPTDLGAVYYDREELNGDAINDAIYTRNTEVEERFNVVIDTRVDGWTHDQSAILRPILMAGDDAVDLVALGFMQSGASFISNGLALPWNDIPYVDLQKPYWNQNIVDSLAVKGNIYLLIGDINWTTMCETAVCFFNKQVAEDYSVPDLYALVDEGTWTFDRLYDIASVISHDVDGDGKMTANDMYGCIQNTIVGIYSYQIAANYHTVLKGDDGITVNIVTDKMQSILEFVNKLCHENYTSYMDTFDYAKESKGVEIFFDNRALFLLATLEHGEYFRQFDADFGIVPYPKYDEAQEKYCATSDQWGLACVMPVSVSNPTFNGVITEALCSGSAIHITQAYYDKVLVGKQTRDEESGRMLDLIFSNLIYDFGLCYYGEFSSLTELVQSNSNDLASWHAKTSKMMAKLYQKFFDSVP